MSRKWVNWRVGLIVGGILTCLAMMMTRTSIPEIRNANSPTNFVLVDPRPGTDDWPGWQGINSRNIANSKLFPLQWSPSDHRGWQIAIPGAGNAMPCLWGNRLFLPSIDPQTQRLYLQCIRREDGAIVWKTIIHHAGLTSGCDQTGTYSSVPICDGQTVFIAAPIRGHLWITAIDLAGKIAWQHSAGPYGSNAVTVSSPTIYKSLVIVSGDQAGQSYLTALHRQTGELIWRTRRTNGESLGSPIVATIAERPQLILAGSQGVASYDPSTGESLWHCRHTMTRVLNSVTFDAERVFATTSSPNSEVICIAADGDGDVTKTHVLWRQPKVAGDVPSPVCHNGMLYLLTEDGRLSCLHAASGKIEWIRQLAGAFTASPVVVGEYIFCASETGETYFVKIGSSNPVLVKNSLSDGIVATPIFAGDSIFIRTIHQLHRIVAPSSDPVANHPNPTKRRY